MKSGDLVLTPRGLLAKVIAVDEDGRADLRYVSNGVAGGTRKLTDSDLSLPLSVLRRPWDYRRGSEKK